MLADFGFAVDCNSMHPFAGTIRYAADDVLKAYQASQLGMIKWLPRYDLESAVKVIYAQRNIYQDGVYSAWNIKTNPGTLLAITTDLRAADKTFDEAMKAAEQTNYAEVKKLVCHLYSMERDHYYCDV